MDREPCPVDEVRVVLFFDANMPVPHGHRNCRPPYICLHERPESIPETYNGSVPFNRANDLEVAEWCLAAIQTHQCAIGHRECRYVLATKDRNFVASARAKDTRRTKRHIVSALGSLTFEVFPDHTGGVIATGEGAGGVRLEVFVIENCVSGRAYEIAKAMSHANALCYPDSTPT